MHVEESQMRSNNSRNLYLILCDWSGSAMSAMSNIEFTAPLGLRRISLTDKNVISTANQSPIQRNSRV